MVVCCGCSHVGGRVIITSLVKGSVADDCVSILLFLLVMGSWLIRNWIDSEVVGNLILVLINWITWTNSSDLHPICAMQVWYSFWQRLYHVCLCENIGIQVIITLLVKGSVADDCASILSFVLVMGSS